MFPVYMIEIAGVFVLSVLTVLSNVGGIGGGGIIIPITMSMFGFSTKEAIAISSSLILCGSATRFMLQINQRHPEKDATVIDYSIVILMLPVVIAGSFVGVILNMIIPSIILSSFLTILLIVLAFRSYQKAKQIDAGELLKAKEAEAGIEMPKIDSTAVSSN